MSLLRYVHVVLHHSHGELPDLAGPLRYLFCHQ